MLAIDIPADYWDVTPAGCVALVQGFDPAFADVDGVIGGAQSALANGAADDTAGTLAHLDADVQPIAAAIANENAIAYATPTNDVLQHYGPSDQLHDAADASVPRSDYAPGGYVVADPPEVDPNIFDDQTGTHTQDVFTRNPPDRTTHTTTTSTPPPPQVAVETVQGVPHPIVDATLPTDTPPPVDVPPPAVAVETQQLVPQLEETPPPAPAPDPRATPMTVGDFVDALSAIDFTINLQV